MHRARGEGTLEPHDRMETVAEGPATSVPFALTMELLREELDDFRRSTTTTSQTACDGCSRRRVS